MKPFNMLRNEASQDGGDGGGGGGGHPPAAGSSATPAGGSSLLGGSPAGGGDGSSSPPASAQSQPNPPAPAAATAFDFRTLVDDQGNFLAGFGAKLPDELKGLEKFRSPKQLLEGYSNLSQLLGKKADAVVIPGPDATPEEWAPVLKRLGVPDSPEGYQLKAPDQLPEGVTVDAEELKEFAKTAHQLGLTPQQVAKLQEYDLARAGKSVAGSAAQAAALEAAEFAKQGELLTKEWGNGNARIQKAALAERAALTFGFTPEEVASDPLFRNARFVMTLARAGAAMSEDTLVRGGDVNSTGGLKARAQDVINNTGNPLYKKYWAGDEDTVNQVRNWMRAG